MKKLPSILIITAMLVTISQKNGWSMHQMEEEKEEEKGGNKKHPSKIQKQKKSLPAVHVEDILLPVEKNIVDYSGPQWGLRKEEVEYLFKNSRDFVCVVEFGGHFKRLNPTWKLLLGWKTQELLDQPYINFVHPKDIEKTIEYEKKFPPTGLINRFRCKDGSYRWLDWIGLSRTSEKKIKDESEFPLTIARDITLSKTLEKELGKRIKKISGNTWHTRQRILEAITEIQAAHIGDILYPDKQSAGNDIFRVILRNFIKLSDSEFGFINEITSDQIGNINTHYMWEGKLPLIEANNEQETTQKLEGFFNNFIEDIVATKEPLMVNNIKSYSKKIEIPLALPQLKSFLGIPLINQDKLIGIIGLSNRAKNINKNLMETLDPIFLLSRRIINEKKIQSAEKEIERQQVALKQA
ncbi:MAG: GAF domain-containing protein, partial [Silvanigrellaceae bacterium]|nr:GAF domain-containing protein [Silvanigrellaceae bacterium]